MAISPMSYSVGWLRGLSETRENMVDLQRQMTTGKKADLYSGLGGATQIDTAVLMRAKIKNVEAYESSVALLTTRMETMDVSLERFHELTREMRTAVSATVPVAELPNAATLKAQAQDALDEAASLLNAEVGGRYMFAGRKTTTEPVVSSKLMIDGDMPLDGFKQVAAERLIADQGQADGNGKFTGRLDINSTANDVQLAAQATDYGMKIAGVEAKAKDGSDVTAAHVTSTPSGSGGLDEFTVDFTSGRPQSGDTMTVKLELPDGSTTSFKLKAVYERPVIADSDPDPVKAAKQAIIAEIDADDEEGVVRYEIPLDAALNPVPGGTLTNFETALTGEINRVAATELESASAFAAADDFFDADPPRRVDTSSLPLDQATTSRSGAADTVDWYKGDTATDPRKTSVAAVADGVSIEYGAQANEAGLKDTIKNLAVMAIAEYDLPGEEGEAIYSSKSERLISNFRDAGTDIGEIRAEIAQQNVVVSKANERNGMEKATAENLLSSVEDADINEVAVSLLQLQTQLQGSYQVTAMLSQLSLVNLL